MKDSLAVEPESHVRTTAHVDHLRSEVARKLVAGRASPHAPGLAFGSGPELLEKVGGPRGELPLASTASVFRKCSMIRSSLTRLAVATRRHSEFTSSGWVAGPSA